MLPRLTLSTLCLFLLSFHLSLGVIVFQQPSSFGTMQIQLTTTAGFISTATSNTFTYANPGYNNITALGLALCGYDIQNPMTLQFRAESSFDSSANSIVILVLPLNTTRLAFINYYLIIVTAQAASFVTVQNTCIAPANPFNTTLFNRAQNYQLISPFPINSSSRVTGMPFIRSVNNIVASQFNSLQITGMTPISGSGVFNLTLFNNYSFQSEVCLSVLYYWDTQGLRLNLLNVSYSPNFLIINSSNPTQSLASVSQQNFTLNNMYGPIFNKKCLVGFQSFRMGASIRQTVSFNLTGNGIYGIVSSSNYVVNYAWFCMAMITCQGLLSQYYPAINDCQVPCTINNCSICQTSTSCSQCGNGFFLNTLYRCSECMPNCVGCVNSVACLTCANGFFYNGSYCMPCPQFCLSCVSGGCRTCQAGYYPSGLQCIRCSSVLPNCLSCSTGSACTTCPDGFYSSSSRGCIRCSTVLVGCNTCALALICSTCNPGFYLVQSQCRNCTATVNSACCGFFIPNCTVCRSQNACNLCVMGFYLASGSAKSCLPCGSTLSNCISCSGPSTCLLCSNTYFLNQYSQCVPCNSSISQCATCANSSACTFCQLPFLMVNGSCLNCPIWPTRGLYYLDQDNVCQPCSATTPNCIHCNQMTCTQCSDLYFLSKTNNCNLCADYFSNCLSCNSGVACTICINGYYPDLDNSSFCSSCANKLSFCTSCSNVLDVTKNTYSLVCMGCQNEYYLNGSICSPCIESINFCLLCSNNFQCQLCQAGYFLGSTLTCISCGELIAGCTACQSNSICLSCAGGYYLINNYCTACQMAINSCFGCGRINGTLTCSSCLAGFYLATNFTCLPCNSTLQFCSACRNASACTACISGYIVSYALTCTSCASVIPYCQYCTTTCMKCVDNYMLDNFGQCRSCGYYISGCGVCEYDWNNVTAKSELNCTACLTGYLGYLLGNFSKCVACNITIPNCIACASLTVCNQCSNLSFINSKNTCSLCSLHLPNCLYCSSSATCLTCLPSYYLNDKLTCEYCDVSKFGNDGSALKLNLCLNCKYMSGVAVCLGCIVGYYVSANGCTSCVGAIANCLNCASSSLCIQCQSGYYLSSNNNQCLSCPPALTYCAICDLNGLCLQCMTDSYLNSTSNACIKCFQITPGCSSCDSNRTCLACSDGYYLSGLSCMSCSSIFQDCLLCFNSSACALYSSNYTVSTSNGNILTYFAANIWMYIALGCFGAFVLIIVACFIWRKCRSKEEKSEIVNNTKGQTERELYQEQHEGNDVRIGHGQFCQHCKTRPFNIMNIELLCSDCEGRAKGKKDHIIRRDIGKQRIKESILSRERMVRESSSYKDRKKGSAEQPSVGKSKQSEQFQHINLFPKGKQTQSQHAEPNQRKLSDQQIGKPVNKKASRSIM